MPEPFPNHLVSIPNSVVSFKHYFLVHDQRFGRTAIYLGILAVLVTALSLGLGIVGYAREAPKIEARQAAAIQEKLATATFQGGKAASPAAQPVVLYEDYETLGGRAERAESDKAPEPRKARTLLVVLDTTGKLTTPEAAAAFAGCPEPKRIILFSPKAILSAEPQTQQQEQAPKPEPYTKEKLEDLRKLLEEKGAKLPEITLDEVGTAKFTLEAGKVHLILHTPDLMVLVDATDKGLSPPQARWVLAQERPETQMPEFLALVTATEAVLKAHYEKAPRTLDFQALGDLTAASVSRWIAATARQARHDLILQVLPSNAIKMLFYLAFEVLVVALICSAAGLLVSGVLRAGIPYSQILTMAVYAMTPARLLLPILVALAGLQDDWVAALPFIVGAGYTAMATYRTARELGGTGHLPAPAPKL